MSITRDFYLARAEDCARDAGLATLTNVRERCLRAEAAWRSMADRLSFSERLRTAGSKEVIS
jgi:hypothetical protein